MVKKEAVAPKTVVWVALSTLASRILGLIRDMITARYFPPEIRDAFMVAFRFPNLFRRLFTEGAISSGLVPFAQKNENPEAWHLVFAAFMSLALIATLLGALFIDPFLHIVLDGEAFSQVPGKLDLTVNLSRIMFLFLALICLFSYLMAMLHAHHKFLKAAIAPVLFNSTLIAVAFIPSVSASAMAMHLAWAVIVGGILQLLVLLPEARRLRLLPELSEWPRLMHKLQEGLGFAPLKTVIPILLGQNLLPLTGLMNVTFAAKLPQGAPSYFYLADRLLELPLSLIAGSIAMVSLPELSRLWRSDRELFTLASQRSLAQAWFWVLPCAIGMLFLAEPIVDTLFVGKSFAAIEAVPTAKILQVYSLALLAAVFNRQLVQSFFAAEMIWFPAVTTAVALLSQLILSFSFIRFGIATLALGMVLSQIVQLVLLVLRFEKRISPWRPRFSAREMVQTFLPIAVAILCSKSYLLFAHWTSSYFPHAVALGLALASVLFGYLLTKFMLSPRLLREVLTRDL